MLTHLFDRCCKGFSGLMQKSLTQKQLSRLCMLLIAAMLLPLALIALYNYPADDDFGFVLPAATAWVESGSLWAVVKAIAQKTYETYLDWQGDFVSTALFSVTPMVFGIQWYFLDNWMMLALLCLSTGYLVKSLTGMLYAEKSTFWIVYAACLVLVLQFMPAIGYSVFWHNGGQYTTAASTLFLAVGLLLRTSQQLSKRRALARGIGLSVCGFMLGGSFYGPALGAFVLLTVWTLWAFCTRARNRWQCVAGLAFFLAAFVISVTAPGNTVRQSLNGEPVGVAATVMTAVLDSFELVGGWLSPQLLAMLLLIAAVLWKPLQQSAFRFRHPLLVMIGLFGLFSASLAPAIYTKAGYDTERYMNALYFYFLLFAIGTCIYAEGWLIRRLESSRQPAAEKALNAVHSWNQRFSAGFLALVIALTAFGGFEFTIMNTSSVSALKSLVTGEAAQFHADMKEREEYIRITPSDEVAVQPLGSQPYVFKYDRLPYQGIYGRVRYMKWYFELFYNAEHPQE